MNLTRKVFNIAMVFMIFAAMGISQGNTKEKVIQNSLVKAEIENWLIAYTNTMFVDMNPGESFNTYFFLGKFTKAEYEIGLKGMNTTKKIMPKGYLKRYLRLNFERSYYELFFSMRTKGFIENFTQASFDNNGFTTISNIDYTDLLMFLLEKNKISREDFIKFFKQDFGIITKTQTVNMERLFNDILIEIKAKINKSNYDENVKQIQNMWEIRDDKENPKYCLVINKWAGTFILGKKNRKIQVLDFPAAIN